MIKHISDKYYLRYVKITDAKDIFEFASDYEVVKYLTWQPHQSIEETKNIINNLYLKPENNLPPHYVIVDSELNKVIGVISFYSAPAHTPPFPHIGYFLSKKYWNKGVMTKALHTVLEIGFNILNFDCIAISHQDNNLASKKVILNNKFKYIRTYQNIYLANLDKFVNTYYYELRKEEYNE